MCSGNNRAMEGGLRIDKPDSVVALLLTKPEATADDAKINK